MKKSFFFFFLVIVFVVLGVEAVEDGPSEGEDGGSPSQTVAPVKLVVNPQTDRFYELDGEQDQAAHLQHHCKGDHIQVHINEARIIPSAVNIYKITNKIKS